MKILCFTLAVAAVACADAPTVRRSACETMARDGALLVRQDASRLVLIGVAPEYQSGRVYSLSFADETLTRVPIEATGDTVARPLGRLVALLHRAPGDQDNLTLFDPRDPTQICQANLVTDDELRAARGRRPYVNAHDVIAINATTLFVARRQMNALAILDVAQARVVRTIDLTPWQGRGVAPFPESLARVGDEVWLTLQRHDDPFQRNSMQPGLVLRIDPVRERVVGTIAFRYANPVGPLVASPDARIRASVTLGSYDRTDDGAVEAIDVATGRLVAPLVTEAELGANIDAFVWLDADRIVLRLSDARVDDGELRGVRTVLWSLSTRRATPLVEMSRWGAAAPVVAASRLYVADPGTGAFWQGAGLRVYPLDALAGAGRFIPMAPGYGPYDVQVAP